MKYFYENILSAICFILISCVDSNVRDYHLVGTWAYFDQNKGYSEMEITPNFEVYSCSNFDHFQSAGYKLLINQGTVLIHRSNVNDTVYVGEIMNYTDSAFSARFDQASINTKDGMVTFYRLNNNVLNRKLSRIKGSNEAQEYLDSLYKRRDSVANSINYDWVKEFNN